MEMSFETDVFFPHRLFHLTFAHINFTAKSCLLNNWKNIVRTTSICYIQKITRYYISMKLEKVFIFTMIYTVYLFEKYKISILNSWAF